MLTPFAGKKASFWTEYVFLSFLGLYLLFLTLQTATFDLGLSAKIETSLLVCLAVSAVLRLVLLFREDSSNWRYWLKPLLFSLSVSVVWLLVYRNDGYSFLLFLAVLTPGCIGLDYHRVLKLSVFIVGLTVLSAVVCAWGDAIPNNVRLISGHIRSAWGICYPTDFSAYLLYLCVHAWIAWKTKPDWLFFGPGLLSLLIAFFVANSNTGVICSFLFLLLVLLHMLLQKRSFPVFRRLVDTLSALSFPLCGAAMIGLTWLYHRGNAAAARIDIWNHHRLNLPSKAYDTYGLKLFGSPLPQIGSENPAVHNYVDCGYLLILLRYGLVIFVIITLLWILMSCRAVKIQDRRLMLGLALIAVHSISEQHFTEINYNILLILPFAVLYSSGPDCRKAWSVTTGTADLSARHRALVLTTAAAALMLCVLPWLMNCFRTCCSVLRMDSGVSHQRALFLAVFAGLLFLLFLLCTVFSALYAVLRRNRPQKKQLASLCLCLICMVLGFAGMQFVFHSAKEQASPVMDADRKAFEALQAEKDCRVFVTDIPELYQREFGGISRTIYPTEDLSRYRDTVVITDVNLDSRVFADRGFLYAEISDAHAVYTNSEAAVRRLKAAGFHVTGFYSHEKSVDLVALAAMDWWLSTSDDGSLLLSAECPLHYGPYLGLLGSPYRVSFALSLQSSEAGVPLPQIAGDTPVCILRVSSNWGENIIREQTLTFGQFDGEEILTADILCSIPSDRGIEFLVFPQRDDVSVVLHGIRYQKSPVYDLQGFYDDYWHRVSEFCYDLEGTPVMNSSGYHARDLAYDLDGNVIYERYYDIEGNPVALAGNQAGVEYGYDKNGNPILIRYLGKDGEPVMLANGYAELHRVYNGKNQIVKESYFDACGQPVSLPTGQAAVEYGYDAVGHLTVKSFFDKTDELVNTIDGYAREERTYDAGNNLIGIRYFGPDGDPIRICTGYAELRREYNSAKKLVREAYFDEFGAPCPRAAGYCAFEQEYDSEGNLLLRRYLDPDGMPVQRTDGFIEARWERSKDTVASNLVLYNLNGEAVSLDGVNLAKDLESDGWSRWMLPQYNSLNACFYIGSANLGDKIEGDAYTCQIEIEFSNVTMMEGKDFRFLAQGDADGSWSIGNVWNSNLVSLNEPPANGIYSFTVTSLVNDKMADATTFSLGFRCDNWASGAFRVRNVKVERGNAATPWTPGL